MSNVAVNASTTLIGASLRYDSTVLVVPPDPPALGILMPRNEIDCSDGLVRVSDNPPTTVAISCTDWMCSSLNVSAETTLMVAATFCTGSETLFAVTMISSRPPVPESFGVDVGDCADANVAKANAWAPSSSWLERRFDGMSIFPPDCAFRLLECQGRSQRHDSAMLCIPLYQSLISHHRSTAIKRATANHQCQALCRVVY